MTSAEFASASPLPEKCGWMACHFSPCGTGLSNLPSGLPEGSLLILDDQLPWRGHDEARICEELGTAVRRFACSGALLDFQQPPSPALQDLARLLADQLPCPVAVSQEYSGVSGCPVFLPPCPHHETLADYLAPWHGRSLWLDLAVDAEVIQVTAEGSTILPLPPGELPESGHRDEALHCSYRITHNPGCIRFTLWRSPDQLRSLAEEAQALGICALAGLYQELKEPLSR